MIFAYLLGIVSGYVGSTLIGLIVLLIGARHALPEPPERPVWHVYPPADVSDAEFDAELRRWLAEMNLEDDSD